MLRLEIAPDNAATDGFSLEYSLRKVESAYCSFKRHLREDIAKILVICKHIRRFSRKDVNEK